MSEHRSFFKVPIIRHKKFLAFVRTKRCMFCLQTGKSEAHHYGVHGLSQKADDVRAVPACRGCHDKAQQYKWADLNFESRDALDCAIYREQVDLLVEYFVRK